MAGRFDPDAISFTGGGDTAFDRINSVSNWLRNRIPSASYNTYGRRQQNLMSEVDADWNNPYGTGSRAYQDQALTSGQAPGADQAGNPAPPPSPGTTGVTPIANGLRQISNPNDFQFLQAKDAQGRKYFDEILRGQQAQGDWAFDQLKGLMGQDNNVAFKAMGYTPETFTPQDAALAQIGANLPTMDAAAFDQQQYMRNFLSNEANLAQIAQGRTSALGQNLEAIASRNARLGGEAALAAMPGARNSGAGMAAFADAYASPFAQAAAQTQQAQLGLYGDLAGQSMGQYGQNAQFQSSLAQEANRLNAAAKQRAAEFDASALMDTSRFNAQQKAQAAQFNADNAFRVADANQARELQAAMANQQNAQAMAALMGNVAGQAGGEASRLASQTADWYQPQYMIEQSGGEKVGNTLLQYSPAILSLIKALGLGL